jgi:hypothetical protein
MLKTPLIRLSCCINVTKSKEYSHFARKLQPKNQTIDAGSQKGGSENNLAVE